MPKAQLCAAVHTFVMFADSFVQTWSTATHGCFHVPSSRPHLALLQFKHEARGKPRPTAPLGRDRTAGPNATKRCSEAARRPAPDMLANSPLLPATREGTCDSGGCETSWSSVVFVQALSLSDLYSEVQVVPKNTPSGFPPPEVVTGPHWNDIPVY